MLIQIYELFDKNTDILFGDGATATLLLKDAKPTPLAWEWEATELDTIP